MPDEVLTVKELAAYLKISPATAYRLANRLRNPLPHRWVGGQMRFSAADVEEWMSAIPEKATKNTKVQGEKK